MSRVLYEPFEILDEYIALPMVIQRLRGIRIFEEQEEAGYTEPIVIWDEVVKDVYQRCKSGRRLRSASLSTGGYLVQYDCGYIAFFEHMNAETPTHMLTPVDSEEDLLQKVVTGRAHHPFGDWPLVQWLYGLSLDNNDDNFKGAVYDRILNDRLYIRSIKKNTLASMDNALAGDLVPLADGSNARARIVLSGVDAVLHRLLRRDFNGEALPPQVALAANLRLHTSNAKRAILKEHLGVSSQQLRAFYNGDEMPDEKMLTLIADFLGINAEDLLIEPQCRDLPNARGLLE